MKQVSKGMLFDKEWGEQIQLNPIMQALVILEFHLENLTEVANTNLATELFKVLKLPATARLQGRRSSSCWKRWWTLQPRCTSPFQSSSST